MKRFLTSLTILLIVLMALTACGGKKKAAEVEPTAEQPTTAAESTPPAQPTAAPEPTQAQAPAPTATSAPAPIAVPSPTEPPAAAVDEGALPTGKGVPKTYVMTMEMKEEVIKPTEELKDWAVVEVKMQIEPAPGAMSMVVTDKLSEDPADSMMLINLADASYMFDPGEGLWMKMPGSASESVGSLAGTVDFAAELAAENAPDVFNKAHLVDRHELVDGVDTTHYRLVDSELELLQKEWMPESEDKLISGQADYWIANDGDYLKQSEFVSIVEDDQGQQKRNYSRMFISDENQPVDIQAPPEDQVRDMLDFGTPKQEDEKPPAETAAGEPPEVSAAALALLDKIPAPPASKELADDELSDDVKFFAQMMGQAGPRHIYESTEPVEVVREFYNEELGKLGLTSLLGDQAPEMSMAVFLGAEGGVQLLTQADPTTGNTIVFVQVMAD